MDLYESTDFDRLLKIDNRKPYPRWRTACRRKGDRGSKCRVKERISRSCEPSVSWFAVYRMCNECNGIKITHFSEIFDGFWCFFRQTHLLWTLWLVAIYLLFILFYWEVFKNNAEVSRKRDHGPVGGGFVGWGWALGPSASSAHDSTLRSRTLAKWRNNGLERCLNKMSNKYKASLSKARGNF